jgi:hypothetical protein
VCCRHRFIAVDINAEACFVSTAIFHNLASLGSCHGQRRPPCHTVPFYPGLAVTLGISRNTITFTTDFYKMDLPGYSFILGNPCAAPLQPRHQLADWTNAVQIATSHQTRLCHPASPQQHPFAGGACTS